MVQGLIGGMTNYNNQSLNDIVGDINDWIGYSLETKNFLEDNMEFLKKNDYWNNIPFNFQMTLYSSIRCQNTFISDMQLVLKAIDTNHLTKREVELIKNIGNIAIEYNREYGQTYKEDSRWKNYGDENFRVAEQLYAKGRDYFVTMQDASNLSARLNNYINTIPPIVNQSIHQTVNGAGNIVTGVNNGSIEQVQINNSQFASEINSVLEQLKKLEDIDPIHKLYIEDVLNESKEAVEKGDQEAQSKTKTKMKSFLESAGSKALSYVNLLSAYSSIASYFQF